jgi:hypothetical protein
MKARRIFGTVLAGILAMGLVPWAGADIMPDPAGGNATGAVSFANETLPSAGSQTIDSVKYYMIDAGDPSGDSMLRFRANLGVRSASDGEGGSEGLTVTFTLDDMLFTAGSMPTLELFSWDATATPPAHSDVASTNVTATLITGGGTGHDFAVFRLSGGDAAAANAELAALVLDVDELAIPASTSGSVSRTVRYVEAGVARTVNFNNAVMTKSATMSEATPMNATSRVAHDFMGFGTGSEPSSMARMGSLALSARSDFLSAVNGINIGNLVGDVADDADTADVDELSTGLLAGGKIVVTGDFSFVTRATLSTGTSCPATVDHRDDTDPSDANTVPSTEMLTRTFAESGVNNGKAVTLCLHVPSGDDAMPVPATSDYVANVTYNGKTGAAMQTTTAGPFNLGRIDRDGASASIGFLTTQSQRKHRVHFTNRGSHDAVYMFTFTPEDGVTVTPGSAASGTIDGNGTLVLDVANVVTISGPPPRTAAMVSIAAEADDIDVTSTLVNQSTGTQVVVEHEVQ